MFPKLIRLNNSAYVSYVKNTPKGFQNGDGDSDETALISESEILILNGDHRKEIAGLIAKFGSEIGPIKKFFEQKKSEWGSSWSMNSALQCFTELRQLNSAQQFKQKITK